MTRLPLPLVLLLSVLIGAFLATRQPPSAPPEKATSHRPQALRAERMQAAASESDSEAGATRFTPGKSRGTLLESRLTPIPPATVAELTTGEIAARKQAALEELLAWIDVLPGWTREEGDRLAQYAGQLATAENPHIQCWSPDTPPDVVQAYLSVERYLAQAAGFQSMALQGSSRWSRTATNGSNQGTQGTPVTLTWSIVADGTPITASSSGESSDPSSLRARLATIYGGSATGDPTTQPWFAVFQATFDNLAANTGLRFVYEPADDGVTIDGSSGSSRYGILGQRADIRIGGHPIDGNSGVLAYAYFPDSGDIVIDTNDSYIATTSNNSIRLRNILEHEIGHSLGLPHVCPVNQTKLMEPFINLSFRGSQFDDIYSQQRRYGDPLEVHGALRNNDTAINAHALEVTPGTTASWQWLSIDDNSDIDFYSLPATRNQLVTVRIIPSDPILPADPATNTYLEGPQNSDGSCSAGTAFDPTNQHNLVLDFIGADRSTVIATAPAQPAGATEEILDFRPPADGTLHIRVRGDTTDRAQLYRMEVLVVDAPPAPEIVITSVRLDAESNSGGNGVADPDETIRLGITLANNGNLAASALTASLSVPGGTIFQGSADYGTLAPGASGERIFTLSAAGLPGEIVNLSLAVTATDYSIALALPLTLGTLTTSTPLQENFDAASTLPAGWSQSTSGAGSPWVISTARSSTAPHSAFSASVTPNGEALLFAPALHIGQGGGVLEFDHRYLLESSRDGGVLEASRNGGAWFDLLTAGGTVLSGGYNGTINSGSSSAIRGRQAWTGSVANFVTTRISLPAAWTGESIAFRWRLVHNSATAVTGWHVDRVSFSSTVPTADPFRPYVSLTASATALSETTPAEPVTLTLSTPLPLVRDLTVALHVSGSADSSDVSGPLVITIPAGEMSATLEITAVPDALGEGAETLILSLPEDDPGFAPLSPTSVSVDIADTPPIPVEIILSSLEALFDGTAKSATATTDPDGIAVSLTYDGTPLPPTRPGSYTVVATVTTPGYSGGAEGTLIISSAYAAWIATHGEPDDPATLPDADLDGDGWSNLAEYAFGTHPGEAASFPRLLPVLADGVMRLDLPDPPPGVIFTPQTSTDLETWTTHGIAVVPGGIAVPQDAARRFLRVGYLLAE